MNKIFFTLKGVLNRSAVGCLVMLHVFPALWSCSSEKEAGNILKQDQMVSVLLEVYLAESRVNEFRVKRDSSMAIFQVYEQKIFEKFKISDSVYRASLAYYYDHPDELESIYETLLDSLNLMEKKIQEKKKGEEKDGDQEPDEEKEEGKKVERQANEDEPSGEKLDA